MSELPPQMSLGSIITALEQYAGGDLFGVQVSSGLYCRVGTVGSYRGYYDQFSLEPCANDPYRNVAELLVALRGAINETFKGYKGGEFEMTWDTPVWVSEYGEASGEAVVAVDRVWMEHIKKNIVVIRTASYGLDYRRGADGVPEDTFLASLVAAPPTTPPTPPTEDPPKRYIDPADLYVGRIEPISLPTPEEDLRSVYETLAAVAVGEGHALYPALTWEMHQSELVAYAVEPVQAFVLALRLTTNKATPWQFGSCALASPAPFRVEDVRWGVAAKTPVAARDLFVSEFRMCVWHARTAQ